MNATTYKLEVLRHGIWTIHEFYADHAPAKYRCDDFGRAGWTARVVNPGGTTIYETCDLPVF
jgi:hypothetical protein